MSDDSEEDYAEFGTPLDPLDEDACPRKKPFTIEEQFARDKHGRRRFHGAFTGGFSAGFLNTVGSLEGWTPSSFKSSKSEKGTFVQQRPEHFMDEEDMGEFGIAPSVLHAKEDFTNSTNNKRKYSEVSSGSVLGTSVLKSLLQPVRETIGIKLLRKMGWKPGQGTGPRVSKHEKQRISKLRRKVYGCSLPDERDEESDPNEDDDDDDELENITFAPSDYPFQLVIHKENLFGLGYKGLEKRSILSAPKTKSEFRVTSKKTITGQAFGVGAFEEEDEDIYMRDDMSQYDFMLDDGTGRDKGAASGHVSSENLYDEFALATKKTTKKVFPPPVLPRDYKPVHKVKTSRFEPAPVTRESRKLSPSPERKNATEENEEIQKEAKKITESISFSPSSGGVFRPFVTDIDKQSRYDKYLKLVAAGKKDELGSLQPITMTEWERERERIEFEQASKLFKPLSGVMEDRFTVASQPDDINDPLAMVEKTKAGSEDEIKAAKMKMYGRLTRKIEDWKPSSLLCKRFNIPELSTNEIPIVKNKPKYSIFDDVSSLRLGADEPERKEPPPPKSAAADVTPAETPAEPKDSDPTDFMNLPDPKNKIDLFNAIFLDEDSEDEAAEGTTPGAAAGTQRREFDTPYEDHVTNEKRNTSPPRGIFENLDYSRLKSNRKAEKEESTSKADTTPPKEEKPPPDAGEGDEMVYGPKLPEKFTACKVSAPVAAQVTDECWVEKTDRKKHKKKDKKYKKSKHKSKHKRKKHKK